MDLSCRQIDRILARLVFTHIFPHTNQPLTNMTVTAWIIALNPENPTALALERSLREQGVNATIRQAVDGRQQMPALQGNEQLSQRKAMIYRQAELTTAEVGCYLSHYRLICEAYQSGLSHICLFEDDVVAEPGLGDLLKSIVQLDDNKHLVRLMSLKIRKRKVLQELAANYVLTRPLRGALGTQGYVVNRAGMERILTFGAMIHMPIDKLYDSFFLYDLNCYSVEPHAVYELARPTSVKKAQGTHKTTPEMTIRWQLNKLHRSLMRRFNQLAHWNEYHPATKPSGKQGKSERIR